MSTEDGEQDGKHWVVQHKKPVITIAALVGALTIVGMVRNEADERYIFRHEALTLQAADALYIKRSEAMTLAAAETLTEQVTSVNRSLNFLLVQAAEKEVYDANIALLDIEKNAQQTLQYHDIKRDATLRLKSAEARLQCFRANNEDCEGPRGH